MWQLDCESFRRTLLPFELHDVTEQEHLDFVHTFAERYGLEITIDGETVRFS